MLIQTIKKVVFAKKDAHRYKNSTLQKMCHEWLQGLCFYVLQIKQHDLDFPTRENGKTIILFFFSFVMDCIVVVKLPLSCL